MANVETVPHTPIQDVSASVDFVKLVITCGKDLSDEFSGLKFDVLINGNKKGDLHNGETVTYEVLPGEHSVKIGACSIGINIPTVSESVELFFKWGIDIEPEIVCHQHNLVTIPSVVENAKQTVGGKVGSSFIVIGLIGVISGIVLFPSFSGSVMTAEQHVAHSNAMDFALFFLIGGFVFAIIGFVITSVSSRMSKK